MPHPILKLYLPDLPVWKKPGIFTNVAPTERYRFVFRGMRVDSRIADRVMETWDAFICALDAHIEADENPSGQRMTSRRLTWFDLPTDLVICGKYVFLDDERHVLVRMEIGLIQGIMQYAVVVGTDGESVASASWEDAALLFMETGRRGGSS